MNLQDSNPMHHDPVERALVALERRSSAAPGLNPAAIEQTLARLAAGEPVKPKQPKFNWRSIIMKPAFQISAAAVLAMVLIPLFWLANPGRGGMVFADALAKVADVHSVSYRVEEHRHDQMDFIEITISADPPRMRSVIQPQGLVSIMDFSAGKLVMLNPHDKSAQLMELNGMTQVLRMGENMLEVLKKSDSNDFDQIGQRTMGGHKAIGFRQKKSAAPLTAQRTIWVDQQTQLPLEVELTTHTVGVADSSIVMTDIQWDVPVTEEMFSLTPPSGYHVQTMQVNSAPMTEKDLVDALETLAQLNGGRFPETFDMSAMRTAALEYAKNLHAGAPVNGAPPGAKPVISAEQRQAIMEFSTKVTRGIMFAGSPLNGSDWHYAGKGVVKGDAATPIFWYLPRGATMYRIIDANLNVGDVPADELPKVPSVVLGSPFKQ